LIDTFTEKYCLPNSTGRSGNYKLPDVVSGKTFAAQLWICRPVSVGRPDSGKMLSVEFSAFLIRET